MLIKNFLIKIKLESGNDVISNSYFSGITPRFILPGGTVLTNESPSALDNNPFIEDWYVEMKYAKDGYTASDVIDNSFATCYRGKNLSYVLSLKSISDEFELTTPAAPSHFFAKLVIRYNNSYIRHLLGDDTIDVTIPEVTNKFTKK